MKIHLASLLVLLAIVATIYAKKQKHHYEHLERIKFYVNNVGPYANPTETYEYYSLPFCKPKNNTDDEGRVIKKKQRMGEYIQGDRAVWSDYELNFRGIYNMLIACLLLLLPR
jgi:hypothetical protein